MSRVTYLELPAIFIGALIVAILLMVGWVILLIPAMLSRKVRGLGNLQQKITATVTRNVMKSALKNAMKSGLCSPTM